METPTKIPPIRPLEIVAVQHEGRDLFLLRDPQGIATETVLLSAASVELLHFFDGAHTTRDVQSEITRQTGQIVPLAQLEEFVKKLDAHCFLDSPTYRARRDQIHAEYLARPTREAQFAGSAYSADAALLPEELSETYRVAQGPGVPEWTASELPAGLIAPHIDPARGAASYAHAYATLWGTTPRRVILLGICHAGAEDPFIITNKDYETPLGRLHTDRDLIAALSAQLDWNPCAHEEFHRNEHSIEFQAIYLQHAISQGGTKPLPDNLRVVPILCAFPWQALSQGTAIQALRARIDAFLQALSQWVDETTLLIAGVDLAHVGRRFGDAGALTDGYLERLAKRDRATLEILAAGDRAGFVENIIAEQDERRICGFSACYSLLTLLPERRGEVLAYGQHRDPDGAGAVTFGAVTYPQ